jgi:hypothetical protein
MLKNDAKITTCIKQNSDEIKAILSSKSIYIVLDMNYYKKTISLATWYHFLEHL